MIARILNSLAGSHSFSLEMFGRRFGGIVSIRGRDTWRDRITWRHVASASFWNVRHQSANFLSLSISYRGNKEHSWVI